MSHLKLSIVFGALVTVGSLPGCTATTPIVSSTTSQDAARVVPSGDKILSVSFEPRPVDQVEIGDFHFTPGQPAPLHTHKAPVLGYVSKGAIYYQVAGHEPVTLKTGDAFYEPVGPDILHFDNASKTEEAVFTDFNLEQPGEPFIVFPTPPTAKIDRRAFPTTKLNGPIVDRVDVYAETLAPAKEIGPHVHELPVFGYVASGAVTMQLEGGAPQVIEAGHTYAEPNGVRVVAFANASSNEPAKLVNFFFQRDNH